MTERYSHLAFEHLQEYSKKANQIIPESSMNGPILTLPENTEGSEIDYIM
jgi:hypothetical protein